MEGSVGSPRSFESCIDRDAVDQGICCTYNSYMPVAKLFPTGGSQAVRLPKEYRFEGDEVLIRREGKAVVLEPKSRRSWPRGFFERIRIEDRSFRRLGQGHLPPIPPL